MYPAHLNQLIERLKRLPGVGSRSAERFAFHMLTWSEEERQMLADTIAATDANLRDCNSCGALIGLDPCHFCSDLRDQTKICLVATPREIFSIEETGQYRGLYHVLGGTLSPIEGRGPEQLRLTNFWSRLKEVKEVIIALDSTLEGDATALYLTKELEHHPLQVSRLAFGLPAGCSLDLADEGTLSRALIGRR